MNYKMGISAFALAACMGLFASNANASCASGLIEVKDGGVEMCVTPDEFANLSDEVKATADADDIEEVISGVEEEDEDEDEVDGVDDSTDDSSDDSADDSSDDANEGPDDDGPDHDSSDNESDDD
jgi:hypothetical protein